MKREEQTNDGQCKQKEKKRKKQQMKESEKRNSSRYYCHCDLHCRFIFEATAHSIAYIQASTTFLLHNRVQQFMLYATSNIIGDKMYISFPTKGK